LAKKFIVKEEHRANKSKRVKEFQYKIQAVNGTIVQRRGRTFIKYGGEATKSIHSGNIIRGKKSKTGIGNIRKRVFRDLEFSIFDEMFSPVIKLKKSKSVKKREIVAADGRNRKGR
jgi:hypothetical protein